MKSANVSSTLLGDVSTASGVTATTSDLGIGRNMGVKYLTANALIDGDFGAVGEPQRRAHGLIVNLGKKRPQGLPARMIRA